MTAERAQTRRSYPFAYGRDQVISYPVTSAGVRTRVVEAGSGDRVIVCLHGAGSRADRWIPVMPGLVDAGYHVYAIDFPGHGLADKRPDIDYSTPGFSRVIAGVVDALGVRRAVLAGTSLGGHVAAQIAVDRPDLVSELVLIGSVGISHFPEEFHAAPEALADGREEAIRRKFALLVAEPEMVTDAWVREESMINSSAGAREALLRTATYVNQGCNHDRVDEALRSRGDLPIVLVWGAEDRWTPPSMGHEAHANLPGSDFILMPGCGHAPYFEDPDGFVAVIRSHCQPTTFLTPA